MWPEFFFPATPPGPRRAKKVWPPPLAQCLLAAGPANGEAVVAEPVGLLLENRNTPDRQTTATMAATTTMAAIAIVTATMREVKITNGVKQDLFV